ncbi:MAG TPA: hypothetical protein DCS93_35865 [Microscillaceae bacterium]|nr:hypothetical protein [Microscillaceae bacterium]
MKLKHIFITAIACFGFSLGAFAQSDCAPSNFVAGQLYAGAWKHFLANNLLSTTHKLNFGSKATYSATVVELNNGFEAGYGTIFETSTKPCGGVVSTNQSNPFVPFHKRRYASNSQWIGQSYQENGFDWTKGYKVIGGNRYFKVKRWGQPVQDIINPFYDTNLPEAIASNGGTKSDFLWSEGWELLKHNFGYDANGQAIANQNEAIDYPYLMLYNRYEGIIRVFIYNNAVAGSNNRLLVTLTQSGQTTHALFGTKGRALGTQAKNSYQVVANLLRNRWSYANFTIGYDPCTPLREGDLRVTFAEQLHAGVSLAGRSVSVELPASQDQVFSEGFLYGDVSADNVGMMVLPTIDKLTDVEYTNIATGEVVAPDSKKNKGSQLMAITDVFSKGGGLADIMKPLNENSTSKQRGARAAYFAIMAVSSYVGFSIAGPTQQGTNLNMPPPQPYISYGELKMSGTITTVNTNKEEFRIAIPGSKNAHTKEEYVPTGVGSSEASAPIYNEPLGIVNLINVPEMVYRNETRVNNVVGGNITERSAAFSLKNKVYYTTNDRADIDWSKTEIRVAVRIKDKSNARNYLVSRTYDIKDQDLLANEVKKFLWIKVAGRNSDRWVINQPVYFLLNSAQAKLVEPINFFGDMYREGSAPSSYKKKVLNRSSGQWVEVPFNQTVNESVYYEPEDILRGKLIHSYSFGSDDVRQTEIAKQAYANNPLASKIYNRTDIRGDIECDYILTVNAYYHANDRLGDQKHEELVLFYPMKIVNGNPYNFPISNSPYDNALSSLASQYRVTPASVRSVICGNGSLYQASTPAVARVTQSSIEQKAEVLTKPMAKVYPNPTPGKVHFDFAMTKAGEAKLALYNLSGKLVKVITKANYKKGYHKVSADVSGLKSGVYVYRLETSGAAPVFGRIVVQD